MSTWRLGDSTTGPTPSTSTSTWAWLAAVATVSSTSLMAAGVQHRRLAMLLVVAPLLEEIVVRAGLHEWLLRRVCLAPVLANGLTAAVFGLAHVALRGESSAFTVAVPAWLIGEVYQRTGRLRWCVTLHAAMNAVWLGW